MVLMRAILTTLCLVALTGTVLAEGWTPTLSSHAWAPERVLAIDKDEQTLFMLEHKSPFRAVRELPCTTGQAEGDKMVRGDLRTPEGVYFLGAKIRRPLGWELYGNLAYSLNYPNPMDRIKGKTGSGIWLHGRGKALSPRDTRGCIALKVPDLQSLGTGLAKGTPVIVAKDVSWSPDAGKDAETATLLAEQVRTWAADWQARSDRFFDHFDPVSFSLSGSGDFAHYRANKENIFRTTPWLRVMVDNIHAMQGPDYWVTWFDQYYRSPKMSQTVGKRLYWKQDADGRWNVVAREYSRASEDLLPTYMQATREEVNVLLAEWKAAWESGDIANYMAHYAENARQGARTGYKAIEEYKKTLWGEKPPVKVTVGDLKVFTDPRGIRAVFVQEYEDAVGYTDKGMKTLVLAPTESAWKIQSEEWRRL